MRFGGVWTAVMVAQIAVTVPFPAITYFIRGDEKIARELDPGIRARSTSTRGSSSGATLPVRTLTSPEPGPTAATPRLEF